MKTFRKLLQDVVGFEATIDRPVTFVVTTAILVGVILSLVSPKNIEINRQIETTRIATSIVSGHGFSSPFGEPSGPSAWLPPVYPYLLAGIFHLFGVSTLASFAVAFAINIVVHGMTCAVLYRVATETFGRRVGLYSALGLATFPILFHTLFVLRIGYDLFIPPNIIWYVHLSELLIVVLVWLTLRRSHWSLYGITWGIAALVNTGILALLPAFVCWRLSNRDRWRDLVLTVAMTLCVVAPWLARNYLVFHRPVFIRDNFGIELRVGNQPGSHGLWSANVHPDQNRDELQRLIAVGEAEYAREAGQQAVEAIRSRPAEFVRSTFLRVTYWWIGLPMSSRHVPVLAFMKNAPIAAFSVLTLWGAGLVLRRGNRKAQLFVAVLVFYPLIYYVTHTFGGLFYVYCVQPEMLTLATVAVLGKSATRAADWAPDGTH